MKIFSAFRDGMLRVTRAPALVAGIFLLTFLMALPLGMVLGGMIASSLGESAAASRMAAGVDYDWWQEFSAQAAGLGTAFTPRTIGFGGVLDNLSSMLDNTPHPLVLAGVGAAYVLAWLFLVGGVIDRLARNRRVRTAAFFSASGIFFFRFLRLGIVALAAYAFLFGVVHDWLFDGLYPWATHNLAAERTAFFVRVALYLVFAILLASVSLLFDYAKIRAVVEDRRSMIGALMAAFRFVTRQPAETVSLYLLNAGAFVLLVAVYALVAPGAGRPGWSLWIGFFVTQLYLLMRIWLKLVFYASQTSLFQSMLAHAGYTAAPVPAWPDSPAAEAIGPPAPQD